MILFFNHPSSPEEDEKDKKWILCSSVIAMPNETHSHNETELSFYIFEIFCWVFFFFLLFSSMHSTGEIYCMYLSSENAAYCCSGAETLGNRGEHYLHKKTLRTFSHSSFI